MRRHLLKLRDSTGRRGARSAVAALEFGLVGPVLTIFLMALTDLTQAIITLRRLNTVVQQVGLMATQLSVQPDQSTTLTVAQLNEASSVIYSILPTLSGAPVYNAATNPVPGFAVVVSDVVFMPTLTANNLGCQAGLTCTTYTANMAWSVPLQYGQQTTRTCGVVTQVSATQKNVYLNNLPTTIPTAGIASALTSVLIVDVAYNFTPFFAKFIGAYTMRQTAYFNQRSIVAAYITYNTAGAASGGGVCAGYS